MRGALVVTFMVALVNSANAGPVGPVQPVERKFSLSIEGGADRREFEQEPVHGDVRIAHNDYYLGRISYGVSDRLELSLRIGGTRLTVVNMPDINPSRLVYEGFSKPAFGGQISYVAWRKGIWNVSGIANFMAHRDHGSEQGALNATQVVMNYYEWSVGGQALAQYEELAPYIGFKISDASITYDQLNYATGAPDDIPARRLGIYAGLGFKLTDHISGYVEGRTRDEHSVGGGVRYVF